MRTKRVVTKIERVRITADYNKFVSLFDELVKDGYCVKYTGPYTKKSMFPKVDPSRVVIVAEKEIHD